MSAEPLSPTDADGTEAATPLAAALAERGLSGQKLARVAGVHENSVYAWRAGRSAPTRDSAVRVADALGLPVTKLFPHLADQRASPPLPVVPPPAPRLLPRPPLPTAAQLREAWSGEIGHRLASAMADQGLTAGQVADAAGVTSRTVQRWLAGHTALPDPHVTERLAAAFNLRADDLGPTRPLTPLAYAAQEHGVDAAQLAVAVGVTPQAARNWLAGRNNPKLEIAERVAAALDRPLHELFDVALAAEPEPADQLERRREPVDVRRLPTVDQVLTAPATGRDDWAGGAACAEPGQDPEAWWPTQGDPAYQARATCGGCPVQGDCRDTYLDGPDTPEARTAIWAGLPGARLRSLARTRSADLTASRRSGSRESAAGAGAAPRPPATDATRPSAKPATRPTPFSVDAEPVTRADDATAHTASRVARGARADAPAEPEQTADGRARVIRPAPSSAEAARDPRTEMRADRAAAANFDVDRGQPHQTVREPTAAAIGMAL